ncbi:hypothetical protein UA38_21940 [Photobacterium kishitanii]|nr:hypothetical protein UA38_21940 [Photobacterium kishitanii]KJG56553.1 hypothetical protein UA42_22300 [Photobacterium kishitanii]KJG63360.1 hypothetical protein UA40_22290 [Photobacterium kishitanii]KJG65323.1 hypothetical protein UA41_22175 [Photobacterium kishitanii]PSX21659.1 hypothetical protein C0W52_23040 [Photobacterium kishitanii]
MHLGRSVQSTWRKRLGAPTSPAHPKELPALKGSLGFDPVFSIVAVVAMLQAKLRRGAGVLVVGIKNIYGGFYIL